MGGLKKNAPITCAVLACASLAISGFPFTSGFFSKDAILGAAYAYAPWMYWVGVVTAGMTAFYVWRAFWMTFWGDYRGHGHPHESNWIMLGPLVVLAILSIAGGFLFNVPQILSGMFPIKEAAETGGMSEVVLTGISVAFGLAGIGLSYLMYVVNPAIPEKISSALGGIYTLVYNKYFVDEVYDAVIVHPLVQGSETVLWKVADAGMIDGIVNNVGTQSQGIGSILRLLQSGNIRSYATWVVIGAVVVIVAIGIGGAQ
jgi:NADH-quinone oxidoreductase subunit L